MVLFSSDDPVTEEVRLVAQAAGVQLTVVGATSGRPPPHPGLTIVGPDTASWLAGLPGERVTVLGPHHPDPMDDSEVVRLPAGRSRLAAVLADASAPGVAFELAVVGCSGGVGATTVALSIAAAAELDCVLAQTDRDGTGFDVFLGTEDAPGSRWADLSRVRGTVIAGALRESLPHWGDVRLLGVGVADAAPLAGVGSPLPSSATRSAVLRAARREFVLLVVDAGRGDLLTRPDALLLVAKANLSGVASARRLLARVGPARSGIVLRGGSRADLAEVVAALPTGRPEPVAVLPHVRGLAPAADRGDVGAVITRRPLRQIGQRCLAWAIGG